MSREAELATAKVGESSLKGMAEPSCHPAGEHRWTFLTNYTHVLALIHSNPDIRLREIAHRVGITERAVQRIVHELEEAGYLTHQRLGRRNQYVVVQSQPLRHPIEAHQTIGDLLKLVNSPGE